MSYHNYQLSQGTAGSKKESSSFKAAKRRIKLLLFGMVLFLGWAVMTFWQQTQDVNLRIAKLATLEEKLLESQTLNEQFKQEITRLNDAEYIEQRVRKDFQMSRTGETLYIAPKSAE